jgi:8-oxo-dGTP pyrophosphatase MutT (NUDIX family)
MNMITCQAFLGGTKEVAREMLQFRPAVYGFVIEQDKLLVVNTIISNRYSLPGGGVDLGERLETALVREVREESGLVVEVGHFAGFKEDFFYYNPNDIAFHSLLFYYFCRPLTFDLAAKEMIEDGEVDQPQWIPIQSLKEDDFHDHGEKILELLKAGGNAT